MTARTPTPGLPSWVNGGILFIQKVGVPTAGLCFLLWFLTQTLDRKVEALDRQISDHATSMSAAAAAATTRDEVRVMLLRRICFNTASNDNQRAECVAAR